MPAYSNDIRCVILVDGDRDRFSVVSVHGEEALSSLYVFRCILYAKQRVDVSLPLGHPATLLFTDYEGREHRRHGVTAAFAELERTPTGFIYELELRPHAWLLTLTEYSQVFLDADQSDANPGTPVRDILVKAARQGGLPDAHFDFRRMDGTFRRRYVCQYEESFFNFCARWLEFLGAAFYFDHDSETDILIVDENAASGVLAHPLPYSEHFGLEPRREGFIHAFSGRRVIPPTQVLVRDYNQERPDESIMAVFPVEPAGCGECYFYGEHVKTAAEAAFIAQRRGEEFLCRKQLFEGAGTAPDLRPGQIFALRDHPDDALNASFRVESVIHEIDQSAQIIRFLKADLGSRKTQSASVYANRFICLDANAPYRPKRATPWPRIAKVLSAHVETQGGKEYAQLDEQGRYRVRLPFDISDHADGKASCLLHMGKPYAGNKFGMHFPLPAGAEVMLGFINGHPDRPYIAAAIPNPATPSPRSDKNQTSLVVTSLKQNVIEIEDKKGAEHLLLSSAPTGALVQYGTVPNGETVCSGQGVYENTGTGGCYVLSVGGHMEQNTVGLHREDINGGDFMLVIKGDRDERIQGNFSETTDGDVGHTVDLDDYEECMGNRSTTCSASIQTETLAGYGLETVGGNKSITLSQTLIADAATFITLKTAANAVFKQKDLELNAQKITASASGMLSKTTTNMSLSAPSGAWTTSALFNMDVNAAKYKESGTNTSKSIGLNVSVTGAAASAEMTNIAINMARVALAGVKKDIDLFKIELIGVKAKLSPNDGEAAVAMLKLCGLYNKS